MAITLNGDGIISGITDYDSGDVGRVLQVVTTTKTDTFTTTSSSLTDITGLSASITPASTSNKILIIAFDICAQI